MKKRILINFILVILIILLIIFISLLLHLNISNKKEHYNNDEYLQQVNTQAKTYETKNKIEVISKNYKTENVIYDSSYKFQIILKLLEPIEDKKKWFISYKLLLEQNQDVDRPKTIYDEFSEEEIYLIQRVVETETYQRSFECKTNIASVVLNRYYSGRFGDTITEVVTTPYQFAYVRKDITEETLLAVEYAFEIGDTTQGALFFHSFKEAEEPRKTFCGADYIFSDDAIHHFYK